MKAEYYVPPHPIKAGFQLNATHKYALRAKLCFSTLHTLQVVAITLTAMNDVGKFLRTDFTRFKVPHF
jgi:hypothetical protein